MTHLKTILRSLLWGFLFSIATAALSFLAFIFVMLALLLLSHLRTPVGFWITFATAFVLSTLVFATFRWVHLYFLRNLQAPPSSDQS